MLTTGKMATLILNLAFLASSGWAGEGDSSQGHWPKLPDSLPRDPLMVVTVPVEQMPRLLDGLLDLTLSLAPATARDNLVGHRERLDSSLSLWRAEGVLSHLGPEIGFTLDLPPVDRAVTALHLSNGDALEVAFGKCGILAGVRDARRLEQALRRVFDDLGADMSVDALGVTRVRIPSKSTVGTPTVKRTPPVTIYYAVGSDRFALGFTPEWVSAGLENAGREDGLTSGEDFLSVFSGLDSDAPGMTYINLPKLHELIVESRVIGAIRASDARFRRLVTPLLDPEWMDLGLGSTSIEVHGRVRTTRFGPHWLNGPPGFGNILAAKALQLSHP